MGFHVPTRLPAVSLDRVQYLASPMTEAYFQMVVVLEGRLDEARLRRALRLAMDAEPVFGCRYVAARNPYWKRRDDLDSLPLCEVIESSATRQVLVEFSARPHDAAVDPLVQACIVRGAIDTLCLRLSHCAADAAGGRDFLNLIASIYRKLGDDPDYRVPPNLGSRSLMQMFRHVGLGKCFGIRWRSFRQRGLKPFRHVDEWRFPTSGPGRSGAVKNAVRRLGPESFDAMRAFAKARGATLNDVLVAAYFRSLFQYLDPQISAPQRVLMPFNLRRFLPSGKPEAICNFFTVLPVRLGKVPGESFEGTLKRVSVSAKVDSERPGPVLLGAMKIAFAYRFFHRQVTKLAKQAYRRNVEEGRTVALMSNLGSLMPEEMDFGLPVADAHMISFPSGAPWVFLAVVSFRKTLICEISYSSRAIQTEVMEGFLDHFVQELAAAGAGQPGVGLPEVAALD